MKRFTFLTLLWLAFAGCSEPSDKIIIATAANVQYVMREIKQEFEKEYKDSVHIVVSSSGKLTAQIREGAPMDVFVSADTKYPDEIFKNGGGAEKPKVYALGTLVLWSAKTGTDSLNLDLLTSEKIKKIAIPNPETAPYGRAAIEALKAANIYEKVKGKLVFGESIAQTAQYITSGAVETGFNALSIVLAKEMKDKGEYVVIDSTLYQPIEQSALLLNHSDNSPKKETSKKFYDFVYSAKAKAIFKKYGYK
jgi:molybdate transport system substrate-binding protein